MVLLAVGECRKVNTC